MAASVQENKAELLKKADEFVIHVGRYCVEQLPTRQRIAPANALRPARVHGRLVAAFAFFVTTGGGVSPGRAQSWQPVQPMTVALLSCGGSRRKPLVCCWWTLLLRQWGQR